MATVLIQYILYTHIGLTYDKWGQLTKDYKAYCAIALLTENMTGRIVN